MCSWLTHSWLTNSNIHARGWDSKPGTSVMRDGNTDRNFKKLPVIYVNYKFTELFFVKCLTGYGHKYYTRFQIFGVPHYKILMFLVYSVQ